MAIAGSGAKVSVIESAGVNVPVGNGGAAATQAHVDAHQSGEVFVKLGHNCAGAVGSIVAGKSKNFARRAVKNDGIRDTERAAIGVAVRSRDGTSRRSCNRAASAPDHHRSRKQARRGSAGIDGPELAELVPHDQVSGLRVVNWTIGGRRGAAGAGHGQGKTPFHRGLRVECTIEDATDAIDDAVIAAHKSLISE